MAHFAKIRALHKDVFEKHVVLEADASGAQSKDKDRPDSSARERKEKEDPLTDAFDDASIAAVKDINSVMERLSDEITSLNTTWERSRAPGRPPG